MNHAHVVIAMVAAFTGGEATGMMLALRRQRQAPSPPPRAREPLPQGEGARVIPFARRRTS